jgi:hypothetical protein
LSLYGQAKRSQQHIRFLILVSPVKILCLKLFGNTKLERIIFSDGILKQKPMLQTRCTSILLRVFGVLERAAFV